LKKPTRILHGAFALGVLSLATDSSAQSIDEDENIVNFAYAVVFGTGVYKVQDQKAFVLRVPFSYTLREPSTERPGLKILLPALAGYYDYDYDKILEGELPGDAATLSFVPGLELEYVRSENWRLKPYGQIGFGRDFKNDEDALIYAAGLKSHYRIPYEGRFRFAFGSKGIYSGYDPDNGSNQSLGVAAVGLDAIYPWGLSLFGKQTNLANFLIYNWYIDSPGFEQATGDTESIAGEFEWGIALGFEQPSRLLGFRFERLGLAFRYGGDIKAIRLVTEFPF
jgi:hypothetical protein